MHGVAIAFAQGADALEVPKAEIRIDLDMSADMRRASTDGALYEGCSALFERFISDFGRVSAQISAFAALNASRARLAAFSRRSCSISAAPDAR